MNTFYSIVSICTNSTIDESIAVGLLLSNGEEVKYYVSEKKKRFRKNILRSQSITSNLNFIIGQLLSKCESINEGKENVILDSSLFEYLHSYSNGILRFSKPNPVNAPFSEETLRMLVKSFFKEELEVKQKPVHTAIESIKQIVRTKLIEPVKDKVHTHYKFNSENLPSLPFTFEMECIGQNGVLIGAKVQDFEYSKTTLNNHISRYLGLMSTLSEKFKKPLIDNRFYLFVEEPKEVASEQHEVYDSIQKNPLIKVLHPSEADKVAKEIEQTKATKFLQEANA
ncbi:MAG: hypothetical protein ACJAWV_001222 [Flammeovirgaceae bacterium]|jgi:hypothetical protein